MRRLLLITCSLCLYTGTALGAGGARRPVTDFARDLSRPFVMPTLWRSLADAERLGTPGEVIARGRALMEFFPGWVDGYYEFAWQLAVDASFAADNPESAAKLVRSGLQLLEEAIAIQRTPLRKARLRVAQAIVLLQRTAEDAAAAHAVEALLGKSPGELYDAYYRQALALHDSPEMRSQAAYFSLRQIERDIRRQRSIQQIDARVRQTAGYLRHIDEPSAHANALALDHLAGLLPQILAPELSTAERDLALQQLVTDQPLLKDIATAIGER